MKHTKTYAAALQDEDLEQEPESISLHSVKTSTPSIGGGVADTISPPKTLDEEYELYEETGFVSASIRQYADDVTLPGARVSAKTDETKRWLEEDFLPQAGIVGGQRHQAFSAFLYQDVIQYLAAGNILDENVKNGDGQITGFLNIDPASCRAETVPNKPVLLAPDAVEEDWFSGETTERGEAAAFLQYHPESPLGRKGRFDDRDLVPLSLNDVTYRPRTPPAGEIWGIPITRNVKNVLTEFKNIRKDLARAIRTKAWGIWSVSFDTEVIETTDEVLVDGWSEDEMDDFTDGIGNLEPGEIIGHDGTISFDKHEGEVPAEVLDVLEAYVKLIVAALPTPLYAVGFEENINQFVVREQEKIYDASVESMRATLEETWTPTLKQVCEDHGKDASGVELHLDPPKDESPVRSMELEDLEKFALLADGLSNLFGQDAYRAFKPDAFADLIAQLPDDALKEEAFIGVPGGVPGDVELLPYLSVLNDVDQAGSVSIEGIEEVRETVESVTDVGESVSSTFVNPFLEQTGDAGGVFGDDEGEEDGDDSPARAADGTFAGSE